MTKSKQTTLRPFTVDDLVPVAEIEHMTFGSGGYQLLAVRQLYDLFPSFVWVAENEEGKVVGHAFGAIEESGTTGWILNFAVLALYRRTGTGTRLLQQLIAQFEKAGVTRIKTTAEVDNADAIRLYEKLGFEKGEVVEDYYGDGTDRVIYERGM